MMAGLAEIRVWGRGFLSIFTELEQGQFWIVLRLMMGLVATGGSRR